MQGGKAIARLCSCYQLGLSDKVRKSILVDSSFCWALRQRVSFGLCCAVSRLPSVLNFLTVDSSLST